MITLILLGLLSGLFFSTTFVLNRVMSLDGGHWVWSASLRYGFMILMLFALAAVVQGGKTPYKICKLFFKNWAFWIISGSVGFGGFYSLICFAADYSPGWVIAATWQLTIIASLIVLTLFGRKFPKNIWFFSLLIFIGVVLVNVSSAQEVIARDLLLGGLPVLVAAFCYPLGNQLVWEAQRGSTRLPDITHPLIENAFNKVLLLSLGSVPFWLVLLAVSQPPAPSRGQLLNTALVAVFSGIVATSLFLYARSRATRPSELAAIDATQSSEVIFAMLGEVLVLAAPLPGVLPFSGMVLVFFGLFLFIRYQESDPGGSGSSSEI